MSVDDDRLTLDPRVRIIPERDLLHIVQNRGTFDVRAKGLDRLHRRLAPVLDGRFTREDVLASAGPHARAVARYLDRLSEIGALRRPRLPSGLPGDFPLPREGIQVATTPDSRIAVTLSGRESTDSGALRVSFASSAEMERRVASLGHYRIGRERFWIACDAPPSDGELETRAAIARHLLALEHGVERGRRLGIFHLDSRQLVLRRLALAADRLPLSSLPSQLELVRFLERPQLPLVSMVAELPHAGLRRVGFGLDAHSIREALTAAVLGSYRLRLKAGGPSASVGVHGSAGAARRAKRLAETPEEVVIGVSPEDRDEKSICRWAIRRRPANGRTIDLISEPPPSRRVASLQSMLERRRAKATWRMDESLAPLLVLRSEHGALARLGLEEVLAEALVLELAASVGLDERDALLCVPSQRSPIEIRRRLAAVRTRLPESIDAITGRMRCVGSTYYFGLCRTLWT